MGQTELSEMPAPARGARDERRDAIIKIAREAFAEDGYAGTSMSTNISRSAG